MAANDTKKILKVLEQQGTAIESMRGNMATKRDFERLAKRLDEKGHMLAQVITGVEMLNEKVDATKRVLEKESKQQPRKAD